MTTIRFTPEETAAWYASVPKVALSASALLRDEQGRIALVRNTYRDGWSLPGGVVDDNEAPAMAAVREVHEEIGHAVDGPATLLVVQWAGRGLGPVQFLNFTFDVGRVADPARLVPQEEEIAEIAFFAPDALPQGLRPFMRHRMDAIIGGGFQGVAYIEENETF
ncbi:NUDIX hydrolase [Actinospica sp. MGRD01-02]|uniref:NUDIX hydrolase n=1 Tax=Actinospica acidithermotolerans TaxID=2828514 RepID=A0A941EDR0_9ACTN|nr:NUDIX hydrolase [Actinospica acidithermotolerans]MBR7830840.1 NUDIX hydrolase [Actinospica acidithermotolerans]